MRCEIKNFQRNASRNVKIKELEKQLLLNIIMNVANKELFYLQFLEVIFRKDITLVTNFVGLS